MAQRRGCGRQRCGSGFHGRALLAIVSRRWVAPGSATLHHGATDADDRAVADAARKRAAKSNGAPPPCAVSIAAPSETPRGERGEPRMLRDRDPLDRDAAASRRISSASAPSSSDTRLAAAIAPGSLARCAARDSATRRAGTTARARADAAAALGRPSPRASASTSSRRSIAPSAARFASSCAHSSAATSARYGNAARADSASRNAPNASP